MISFLVYYILLLAFVGNSAVFILVVYLLSKPHRAKIFISYSHKDSEVAEKIMESLSDYHFRIWIDLGIAIPSDQLEKKLSRYIKKSKIFLMLASSNSVSSQWVRFELKKAREPGKSPLGPWRDALILALDEQGVQLYEALKESTDEWLVHSYAKELNIKDPHEIAELVNSIAKLQEIGASQPFGRRVFFPMITLIDLREPFSPAMQKLAEHLKLNTRLARVAASKRKRVKWILVCLLLWTSVVVMISGALLIFMLLFP